MTKLFDNVKMTVSGTPGTGDVALGSALNGHQSFSDAGVVNGDTPISVRFDDGNAWELSRVTYSTTGPTLTGRTLVDSSTGSLLSLTSAASAACVLFKEDIDSFTQAGTGAVLRTVTSRLRDTVHAADFGVVADATDQTSKLQAAIDALPASHGIVSLPGGTIVCASSLNLESKQGVTLSGKGRNGGTVLSFSGSGAGDFINCRSTFAVYLEDLDVTYTHIAFTGKLVTYDHGAAAADSTYGGLRRVNLTSTATKAFTGNTTNASPIITSVSSTTDMFVGMQINGAGITYPTAIHSIDSGTQITLTRNATATASGVSLSGHGGQAKLLDFNRAIITSYSEGTCYYGNPSIQGQAADGSTYSNAIQIDRITFIDHITNAIQGLNEGWSITGCTNEHNASGRAGFIYNNTAQPIKGVTIRGNWLGDVTLDGGTQITLAGATGRGGLKIFGNMFGGSAASYAISLSNMQGAEIVGNAFDTFVVAVDFAGATCNDITIHSNVFNGVSIKYNTLSNLGTGCSLEGQRGLGTEALPSYALFGDLNTGLFSPGADIVALSTGGTERVRWGGAGMTLAGPIVGTVSATRLSLTGVGTTSWTIDGSVQITVADDANAQLAPTHGLVLVRDTSFSGSTALVHLSNNTVVIISQGAAADFVVSTTPGAGKTGVNWDGSSQYKIYNNTGGSVNYSITSIKA